MVWRGVSRWIPTVVWVGAIGAAVSLYRGEHTVGSVQGFAEDRSITIAPSEVGRVRELRASLHQFVEPGDILVQLDDRECQLRLATLTAELERLRKDIDAERSQLAMSQTDLELTEEDLSRRLLTDRESAHIQYLSMMAIQAGDQARLNGLMVEEDILNQLLHKKDASFREVNNFKTEIDAVRARLKSNEDNLARMHKAFRDADLRWYMHHEQQKMPYDRDAVLAPLHVAVQVKEHEILELVHRIDENVRRSPIHGQVTALYAGSGDTVNAGDPILVVSPTSTRRVIAFVSEAEAGRVRVGAPMRIHPAARSPDGRRAMDGEIVSVADTIREAPERFRRMPNIPVWGREIVIRIDGDAMLIPGESVSINWQRN